MVISSTEVSPYTSPYASTTSSPARSRNPSPNRTTSLDSREKAKTLPVGKSIKLSPFPSPLQLLHRANSYRKGQKLEKTDSSNTEEETHNGRWRLRSKSSPIIVYAVAKEKNNEVIINQSEQSIELSVDEEPKRKTSCPEQQNEAKLSPPIPRKKSLSSLFDLKKHKPNYSKMKKSMSQPQKLHKTASRRRSSEKSDKKNSGGTPLFQATTLFVPGYDFKTKQSTPLETEPRRQSTPLFSRRGSKEKIHTVHANKEKRKSSPNLYKSPKLERSKAIEELRRNTFFQRSDSLPSQMLSSGDECCNCTEEDETCEFCEHTTVEERKAIISNRHKEFAEHKKTNTTLEVPKDVHGKVKNLSSGFEHGKPFWKRYKQKKKHEESLRKHRSCEIEHDSVYRQRARSYESGQAFQRQNSSQHDMSTCSQSSESGYNSPTDNNNTEIQKDSYTESLRQQSRDLFKNGISDDGVLQRKPKIFLSAYDENLSSSWSHGEWSENKPKSRRLVSPDLHRIIATDLCVTEL